MLSQIEVYNGSPDESGSAKFAEVRYTYVDYSTVSSQAGYFGEVAEERSSASHALVNTNALLQQFLNPYNGMDWSNDTAALEPSKGIIRITEYDAVTHRPSGTKIKIGANGTAYYTDATDYNAEGHVSAHSVYPSQTADRNAADRIAVFYTYTYWEENFKQAVKTRIETRQAVPVSQNGSGTSAVIQTYYDSYGNVRWVRSPSGVVSYYGYHPVSGQRTLAVDDADTGSLPSVITTDTENVSAWSGAVPFSRAASLVTPAFNQTTTYQYDKRGRIFAVTTPSGVSSYTVYGVRKTLRFPAWDADTQKPLLPVDVTETNAAGKVSAAYQLPPAAVTVVNGLPAGVNNAAAKIAWTRYAYNASGERQFVDRYHVIPASGAGTIGINFYRTSFLYDLQGRQSAVSQYGADGRWQVSRSVYDWRDRVIEVHSGVAMNAPSALSDFNNAAWLAPVQKTVYDGERVDKTLIYYGTGADDYTGTQYYYDSWGRVRSTAGFAKVNGTETPLAPFTVNDYDWRGNVIFTASFDSEPDWNNLSGNYASAAAGKFSASQNHYDIDGRVWKTGTFNNTGGHFEETTYKYDLDGRRVETVQDNEKMQVVYDSLGRTMETKQFRGTVLKVVNRTEYDNAGNTIGQETLVLNPDEVNGINESGVNFVRRTVYSWYDKAGRLLAQADYGSGTSLWTNAAKPARPAAALQTSAADVLVTQYGYSAATGRPETVTDTNGKINRTEYDALGRAVKTIADVVSGGTDSDENIETLSVYDGFNNILTLTAVNPATGNQVTKYFYKDEYNASLQTNAVYPDSDDADTSGTDQFKTTYYLDGNVKTTVDPKGNVHTFSYDHYRRPVADTVTTLGGHTDGAVRKMTRSYTARGALEKVASLDAQNNILNEVKYEYDADLKLSKLYQSYSGAAAASSPALQYTYDAAHRNRLTGIVYPSGKTLTYNYDAFDHVGSINEGAAPLVSYLYDGSGSPMQTTYHQPAAALSYINGGLDRFGRVVNHSWVKGNAALVHIVHGYDYAGNRTYRNDLTQPANSELYTYDALGQIKELKRGVLNSNQTAVPNVNHSEAWNFDKTGNWQQYTKNDNTENRAHNKANELQGIAAHDANGNMTVLPGLKTKYDAWNRLVEVRNADDTLIAQYEYNGLNQRIKKTVGSVITKSFFNENWQELEEQTGSQMTSYVWGIRYIDDLVLREHGSERLYSYADPNWNAAAISGVMGNVLERYKYEALAGEPYWILPLLWRKRHQSTTGTERSQGKSSTAKLD